MASESTEITGPVAQPPAPSGSGGETFNANSPLGGVLGFLGTILGDAEALTKQAGNVPLGEIYHAFSSFVGVFRDLLTGTANPTWKHIADITVGTLYRDMLEDGLSVNVDEFDDLAKQGVETTNTMLGFAYIMPWIVAGAALIGKIPLAGRWIEPILEPIGRLPEEMGLSWALGAQIEAAYDAAVGESVLEGIRRQKRSSRLDWPIIRQLLRQHAIPHDCFIDLMKNQGFPDAQIAMIESLDSTLMPIGTLQQLWLTGEIDREQFRVQLRALGYPEQDVNWLTKLNIDHAETSAGTLLRSTARSLAANQLITVEQYRSILTETNAPEREIADDVAAVELSISHGHLQTSLASIKNLFLRGSLTAHQATVELQQLGYTAQAIADTIAAWNAGPTPRPLSMAKIVSYYLSGVLKKEEAIARLLTAGVRLADATLIIDHANDVPKARPHPLTPALVTQAYLDGAITHEQLCDAYKRAGATDELATYYVDAAVFRQSRQRRPAGATQPLSESQIVDAWAVGLLDVHTTLNELEHAGYSADDALLLLGIKNKGPVSLQPGPQPLFNDLADALAFLRGLGFTIIPPPDPRIGAAEAVLAAAGYVAIPPLPPTSSGGGSGGGLIG